MTLAAVASPPAQLTGVVTGGAEAHGVYVAALSSRNLRDPDAVLAISPAGPDGRFAIPLPPGHDTAWLVVTERCDPRQLACRRVLPSVDPARPGVPVRLEAPDPEVAATVWRGDALPSRGFATFGWVAIGALVLVGLALARRPDRAPPRERALTPWVPVLLALPVFGGLALVRLGDEPLDLLEYTYFHEALRPSSAAALLTDSLSTELAHGPVYPLLLRAVATLSVDPFWLRLPSVVLGVGFVMLAGIIAGRAAGRRAGIGALVLAAVSPVAAYYARDATPYALVGFLGALAVLLADLRATGAVALARWTAFALVHTLGFFSHYAFAFFSLAQGVGLLVGGLADGQRRTLGHAALAFAAAAVLPVLAAPQLERMLVASGLRFGLMSAVYPESPGLWRFVGTLLSVLLGGPADRPILILGGALTVAVGLRVLWRAHRTLAAQCAACVVLILAWLVFSHTMSVAYGGGRVYWAFRWARPLLVGVVVAAGAAAAVPLGRWLVAAQLCVGGAVLVTTVAPPVRPDQLSAAAWIRDRARAGDAVAVLPASFYGDQSLYYLSAGSPPALVTAMRTHRIPTPGGELVGPYVELEVPLETAIDRVQHRRVFVLAFDEHLFGVPKFSPVATQQVHADLRAHGWTLSEQLDTPFLDAWLYTCNAECAWRGQRALTVRLEPTLAADRFVVRSPGEPLLPFAFPVTLALPEDTRRVTGVPVGVQADAPRRADGSLDVSGRDRLRLEAAPAFGPAGPAAVTAPDPAAVVLELQR